jgi:hypothetical protein
MAAFDQPKEVAMPILFAFVLILAVIAAPALADPPQGIDHYLCYQVTAYDGPAGIPVKLKDQFGQMTAHAAKPDLLCNPVDKNGEGIERPEAHLLCYSLTDIEDAPGARKVVTETQFGKTTLTVNGLRTLCVPSSKQLVR